MESAPSVATWRCRRAVGRDVIATVGPNARFSSGAGTRTRCSGPVRGPALTPQNVSRAESQETRNSPAPRICCELAGCRAQLIVLCYVSSLALALWSEWEVVEVDGLLAGLASAVPAFEDWLQQPNDLGKGQPVDRAKVGEGARG